ALGARVEEVRLILEPHPGRLPFGWRPNPEQIARACAMGWAILTTPFCVRPAFKNGKKHQKIHTNQ
ncbi:MAG: hypothetical protein V4711_09425, partial [Pseudomonadota bacterium]